MGIFRKGDLKVEYTNFEVYGFCLILWQTTIRHFVEPISLTLQNGGPHAPLLVVFSEAILFNHF